MSSEWWLSVRPQCSHSHALELGQQVQLARKCPIACRSAVELPSTLAPKLGMRGTAISHLWAGQVCGQHTDTEVGQDAEQTLEAVQLEPASDSAVKSFPSGPCSPSRP